jgi:hypothetical protein
MFQQYLAVEVPNTGAPAVNGHTHRMNVAYQLPLLNN